MTFHIKKASVYVMMFVLVASLVFAAYGPEQPVGGSSSSGSSGSSGSSSGGSGGGGTKSGGILNCARGYVAQGDKCVNEAEAAAAAAAASAGSGAQGTVPEEQGAEQEGAMAATGEETGGAALEGEVTEESVPWAGWQTLASLSWLWITLLIVIVGAVIAVFLHSRR